jgi:hypothetical protein
VESCADAGVRGIIWYGAGVTLRDGDREYFYKKLDVHFPGLKERYIHNYGLAYEVLSPRHPELDRLFHDLCERYGMMHDNDEIFRYLSEFPRPEDDQLCLF